MGHWRYWDFAVQATDLEGKDDREIVCSEVFADVTGTVSDNAQGTDMQQAVQSCKGQQLPRQIRQAHSCVTMR